MGSKSFIFHFNPVPLLIWEKKNDLYQYATSSTHLLTTGDNAS